MRISLRRGRPGRRSAADYNRPVANNDQGGPRLVILDSHGILFRAFFAFQQMDRPLMTSKGELTYAVYGYAETLLRVIDQLRPTHICAAWDAAGKTFRHEAEEAYKATRRETPEELLPQMARVRELLEAFRIPIYEVPGYEADDVAGTIARIASEQGIETYIATLDTDLVQLVGPRVKLFLFRPYQRDTVIYDEQKVIERWGFSPQYMVDFKALKGDASDNIEGIRGVGEKTAAELIRRFGTVEEIYAHIDEIKGALRQKLLEGKERALANKELIRIRTDAPVQFDLEACRFGDFDRERVAALFRELEFRVLAQRLNEILGEGLRSTVESEDGPVTYETIASRSELEELARRLGDRGGFAVATLTTTGEPSHRLLLGAAFSTEPREAWYLPMGHAPRLDGELWQATDGDLREAMGPLFASPEVRKTGYGLKYVMHQLDRLGIPLEGLEFDVSIAAFLLGMTSPTLPALANERLHVQLTDLTAIAGRGKRATPFAQLDSDVVAEHACQQADVLQRLRPLLEKELHDQGQWRLFTEMEMPLVPVLFRMEKVGVAVDVGVLRELSQRMAEDIRRLEQEIYSLVGHEFNIGSPQQLSRVLFEELGLPKTRRTSQGYSTDQRALEGLRGTHPIIDLLFEYRQLTKLKSTYLDALPAAVAEDGRIHTDFQQTVASTGRLSSTNPNLQNIPVRTELGREIRRAFIASYFDDPWLVAADYSQIELRVLAHVTGDEGLIAAFLADQDIHRATAAKVYGVDPSEVTREMRDTAKMVNFGIAYGMGEFGLASRTGMTREEADAFIRQYFENFPKIREWQQRTLEFTRANGYAETIFGRRRYLPAITSSNFQVRSAAEREAINMPIQGTAADIIKIAMVRIDEALRTKGLQSRMILQIHDELIFECPADEVPAVRALCEEIMPKAADLRVPLKVDIKQGRNWGEMEE